MSVPPIRPVGPRGAPPVERVLPPLLTPPEREAERERRERERRRRRRPVPDGGGKSSGGGIDVRA